MSTEANPPRTPGTPGTPDTPAADAEQLLVDGQPVSFAPGQTIAAALLAADRTSWRTTRSGRPRGIFCGIGVCFDCLVTTNGRRVRACLEPARPGEVVTTGPMSPGIDEETGAADHVPSPVPPTWCDAVVVGAGPAGLTAANAIAEHGLSVVLLDAGERPGGQYYRHSVRGESAEAASPRFRTLRADLDRHVVAGRIDYRPRHQVWTLERTPPPIPAPALAQPADPLWTVHALVEGPEPSHVRVVTPAVVVATGAYDRQIPFPGWDLAGVVAAGGAQALLKGSGVALGGPVVVAGSGPFLLPVATGLAAAGVQVAGVYEASRARDYLRHARTLAGQPGRFAEAAGYARKLALHKVPYRTGHAVVAAHGGERLTGVTVARLDAQGRPVPGSEREIECGTLAIGYGFTPQLDLLIEAGCDVGVGTGGTGSTPAVLVDAGQRTTCPGLYSAGEATGVGGAALALVEGELAGLAVADAAGCVVEEQRKDRLLRRKDRLRAFADVLDAVHPLPTGWLDDVPDETVLCRCEEVPVGAVREAVRDLGAVDPRSAKLLTRVGMGWCQGRTCAVATAALVGRLTGSPPDVADAAALSRRPLAQPVPLGVLASLTDPPGSTTPPTEAMEPDEPSGGTDR